jgi:hypothetical protein
MFILNPDFSPSRIPIPGIRGKKKSTRSRIWIRNTAYYAKRRNTQRDENKGAVLGTEGWDVEPILAVTEIVPK